MHNDAYQKHIVIAVDFESRDDVAVHFMLESLWQPGIVVNLVHVVLAREEYNEVYHGVDRLASSCQVPMYN
jgi:hypothetical protein